MGPDGSYPAGMTTGRGVEAHTNEEVLQTITAVLSGPPAVPHDLNPGPYATLYGPDTSSPEGPGGDTPPNHAVIFEPGNTANPHMPYALARAPAGYPSRMARVGH